jgi:hypothetical protein
LFISDATDISKKFEKDETYKPDDFDADLEWGVALLQQLALGKRPPRTTSTLTSPLFGVHRSPDMITLTLYDEKNLRARVDLCVSAWAALVIITRTT